MADYYCGNIEIPGRYLTPMLVQDVFGSKYMKQYEWQAGNELIVFEGEDLRYGAFEEEEQRLIEYEIPFDRNSGQYHDNESETRYCRPAQNGRPEIDRVIRASDQRFEVELLEPLLEMSPTVCQAELRRLILKRDLKIKPLSDYY